MSDPQVTAAPSRRVLIIEDSPDGREMLSALLEAWGHQVQAAADGAEGVRKALGWQPEVAVVDIGLPLVDGYEVARRLRAALHGRVRLIALTGYGTPEDRAQALASGFDTHLTKPADPDELRRLVATV
jgi:CheY-like chemotaxis protein